MKLTIRPFQEKDRENVRKVCLDTCFNEFLLAHTDVLYLTCCDYYMNECADTVFVTVDENDEAKGYILCAPDFKKYASDWKNKYAPVLAKMWEPSAKGKLDEIKRERLISSFYPAHMHIDLSPEIQRMGQGTLLVDKLREALKEKGVKGLHLGCYACNEKGINFYNKYGFKKLIKLGDTVVFTLKI